MAIEAPISKHKKNGLKIFMLFLICFATWCVYDGYFNEKFIEKHTSSEGVADSNLVFNKQAPYYLAGGVLILAGYFFLIKNKKIVADDNALELGCGQKIAYDSIEKIDKTQFESKGYFVVTYKNAAGKPARFKLSDRRYDNLSAVLDELIGKIT